MCGSRWLRVSERVYCESDDSFSRCSRIVLHDPGQFIHDAEATVTGLRSVEGIHVFNQHVDAGLLTVHGACCAEVPIAVTAVTVFIEGMGVHCLSFRFVHYTRVSDFPHNLSMV